MAETAAWSEDRAVVGDPQHYLRHLGPVRPRAVHPVPRRAAPDRDARQYPRHWHPVRRPSARHRRADRRVHPVDHGAALYRLGDARRLRDRAADAKGERLWDWRHHDGGGLAGGAALYEDWGCRRRLVWAP